MIKYVLAFVLLILSSFSVADTSYKEAVCSDLHQLAKLVEVARDRGYTLGQFVHLVNTSGMPENDSRILKMVAYAVYVDGFTSDRVYAYCMENYDTE